MPAEYASLEDLLRDNPGKAPACPMCGAAMRLRDATTRTGEVRLTFACPDCDHPETFSASQLRQLSGIREARGAWTLS